MQTTPTLGTAQPASRTSLLLRGFLCLVLAACLVQGVREAVAGRLAETNTPEAIRQAERWDSSNPEFPAQLGRALINEGADAQEAARAFERSVQMGPARAENWAGLAEAYDLAGASEGSAHAYERALALDPKSPAINWRFANFLVRGGDAEQAAGPLRLAIAGDPSLRTGAFDLAWRAGIPREQILEFLPPEPRVLSAYLDYLVATARLDAAAEAWQRIAASPAPLDLDAAFRYFDALLAAHQVDALAGVWADLARREPDRIRRQPDAPERITNGGFETDALNGGFDWRIAPIEGAEISFDAEVAHSGARSLAVHFDGKANLDFSNVAQYALVEPETNYRLTAYMRTEEITTDSGPRIALYDPFDRATLSLETDNLTGTTGWREETLDFRTGPATRLVVVQLVRPPSAKLDNRISGTVWLDDFSLVPQR